MMASEHHMGPNPLISSLLKQSTFSFLYCLAHLFRSYSLVITIKKYLPTNHSVMITLMLLLLPALLAELTLKSDGFF